MQVTVLTVEQLAGLLAWHQHCNTYCRGDEHAEVVWLATDKAEPLTEADRAEALRGWCAAEYGADYLGHQPAPEAVRPSAMATSMVSMGDQGALSVEFDVGDRPWPQEPVLVRFRSGVPLDHFRQAMNVTGGDDETR